MYCRHVKTSLIWKELEAFADDKFILSEIISFVSQKVENAMGKGGR